MKKILVFFALLLAIVAFSSCQKSEQITTSTSAFLVGSDSLGSSNPDKVVFLGEFSGPTSVTITSQQWGVVKDAMEVYISWQKFRLEGSELVYIDDGFIDVASRNQTIMIP